MIYFAMRDGQIKIGFSNTPSVRAKNLKAKLVCVTRGNRSVERAIHRRFTKQRISGEWFVDCPEIRDYMNGLKPAEFGAAGFIGGNVPQTLYDKLANDAVQCKRSVSKQLEFILEQYFKQREKQNGR